MNNSHYLNMDIAITKPIDGWNPPGTKELGEINVLLEKIGKRLHSLRVAYSLNYESESGRIRRIMASRKRAIQKAYKKGLRERKKSRWYI